MSVPGELVVHIDEVVLEGTLPSDAGQLPGLIAARLHQMFASERDSFGSSTRHRAEPVATMHNVATMHEFAAEAARLVHAAIVKQPGEVAP